MKETKYAEILDEIKEFTKNETDLISNLANISAILFQNLYHITWAGFYLAKGNELIAGPFQGKPVFRRIPFGIGICGKCAEKEETIVMNNLNETESDTLYDQDSNSGIAVPIRRGNSVLGIINLYSYKNNDFDNIDIDNLEKISQIISETCEIEF